jgi:hypothetical protein
MRATEIWVAMLVLGLSSPMPSFAQGFAPKAPVLHEPLPAPNTRRARSDRVLRDPKDAAGLPHAIQTSAGTVPKPAPGGNVPTYRPGPPPEVKADRRTGADPTLHYQMVFDPVIAPFKRETVYDVVQADGHLAQSGKGLVALQRTQPRAEHELFWGHARLVVQAGERTPLPSVAPTSAILEWQAHPPLPLRFWRDRAGNFAVSSEEAGEVDLRWLTDAPSEYFAAPIGIRSRADDPWQPAIDPGLRAQLAELWPKIGVALHMERGQAVMALAEWFRAFQPDASKGGELGDSSAKMVAALVRDQKGVCRHRALGFVAVAHSLGIPAHYVMNDAHAFVEAWVPMQSGRGGWMRIDLGGGSDSLELHGEGQKHLHRPAFADPFPKPRAYAEAYGEVKRDGERLPQAWGGARKVVGADRFVAPEPVPGAKAATAANGAPATNGAANRGANGTQRPPTESEARQQWLRTRAVEIAGVPRPPQPGHTSQELPNDPRPACKLTLQAPPEAWAGEPMALAGQLTLPQGFDPARKAVEVWLIDPGRASEASDIGVALTDKNGRFTVDVAVPPEVALQVWEVVARFAGSAKVRGCDSEER